MQRAILFGDGLLKKSNILYQKFRYGSFKVNFLIGDVI